MTSIPDQTDPEAGPLEVIAPTELVQPMTGELIDVSDVAAVGGAIDDLREFKRKVDEALGSFTHAAILQSQVAGTKTLRAGGIEIRISGDSELEWDVTVLVELLEAGLPATRYAELVTETVSYKVNAAVAKQIEAANSEYGEIVARARSRRPKRQYANIVRS